MSKTLEQLREDLRDNNAEVRWHAVEAIRQLGSDDAISVLIDALTHADGGVRWRAAQALGQLKSTRAVSPLIAALKDSKDAVRQHAIIALGEIGDAAAVAALIPAILEKPSPPNIAVDALVKIGVAAIPLLIQALPHAQGIIRSGAAQALTQLGWEPRTIEEEIEYAIAACEWKKCLRLGQPVVPYLKIRLTDNFHNVALQSAKILALLGEQAGFAQLGTLLEEESGHTELVELNDKGFQGIYEFIEFMQDDAVGSYITGNGSLMWIPVTFEKAGQRGQPIHQQLRWIFFALDKDAWWGKTVAITAFGLLGTPAAIEALVDRFRPFGGGQEDERILAALALFWIGEPAIPYLLPLLKYHVPDERWRAAEILGLIGNAATIEPISLLLHDHYAKVRRAAERALREIGTPEALAMLANPPQ